MKAGAVVGGDDDERLAEEPLSLEAVDESPDEPIHKAHLQQMSLLQDPGEPGVAVEKQLFSVFCEPLVIRGVVPVSGRHILERHVGRQRVEKIQTTLTIRRDRLEESIELFSPVVLT